MYLLQRSLGVETWRPVKRRETEAVLCADSLHIVNIEVTLFLLAEPIPGLDVVVFLLLKKIKNEKKYASRQKNIIQINKYCSIALLSGFPCL